MNERGSNILLAICLNANCASESVHPIVDGHVGYNLDSHQTRNTIGVALRDAATVRDDHRRKLSCEAVRQFTLQVVHRTYGVRIRWASPGLFS